MRPEGHLLDLDRLGRVAADVVDRDARVARVAGVEPRRRPCSTSTQQTPLPESGTVRRKRRPPDVVVAIDADPVDRDEADVEERLRRVDRQPEREGRRAGVGELRRRGAAGPPPAIEPAVRGDPERAEQAPQEVGPEQEVAVGRDQGLRRARAERRRRRSSSGSGSAAPRGSPGTTCSWAGTGPGWSGSWSLLTTQRMSPASPTLTGFEPPEGNGEPSTGVSEPSRVDPEHGDACPSRR